MSEILTDVPRIEEYPQIGPEYYKDPDFLQRVDASERRMDVHGDVVSIVDHERGIYAIIEPEQVGDHVAAGAVAQAAYEIMAAQRIDENSADNLTRALEAANTALAGLQVDGMPRRGVRTTIVRPVENEGGKKRFLVATVGGNVFNYSTKLGEDRYASVTPGTKISDVMDGSEEAFDRNVRIEAVTANDFDNIALASSGLVNNPHTGGLTAERHENVAMRTLASDAADSLIGMVAGERDQVVIMLGVKPEGREGWVESKSVTATAQAEEVLTPDPSMDSYDDLDEVSIIQALEEQFNDGESHDDQEDQLYDQELDGVNDDVPNEDVLLGANAAEHVHRQGRFMELLGRTGVLTAIAMVGMPGWRWGSRGSTAATAAEPEDEGRLSTTRWSDEEDDLLRREPIWRDEDDDYDEVGRHDLAYGRTITEPAHTVEPTRVSEPISRRHGALEPAAVVRAHTEPVGATATRRTPERKNRKAWWWRGVGAAAIVGIVAGGIALFASDSDEKPASSDKDASSSSDYGMNHYQYEQLGDHDNGSGDGDDTPPETLPGQPVHLGEGIEEWLHNYAHGPLQVPEDDFYEEDAADAYADIVRQVPNADILNYAQPHDRSDTYKMGPGLYGLRYVGDANLDPRFQTIVVNALVKQAREHDPNYHLPSNR